MVRHRSLLAALASLATAAPLSAQQVQDWQYKWFWGVAGGMASYELPTSGVTFAPEAGLHWMITHRNAALYLGYSQTFGSERDTFQIQNLAGTNDISFDGLRRIQVGLVVLVGNSKIIPYVGGGFTIHTLTNATLATGTASQTVQDAIDDAASGAFAFVHAGLHYRMSRKAGLFAQYQFTPQGRDFMLAGSSHSFEAGIRYAFLSAREQDPTTRR